MSSLRGNGNSADCIHVVFGVYDPRGTYSRHAAAAMASIFLNTESSVCVHLLHDATLTDENRRRLQETGDSFGQTVKFIDVSEHVALLGDAAIKTARKHLSEGCLFRLLIPRLLDCAKAVYMDCDVLANLDIRELWDIDIDGYCIAGVRDPKVKKKNRYLSRDYLISRFLRMDLADYVNSGVLLMDLDEIRRTCDLADEARKYFARYAHCAPPVDQNFINAVFYKKCRIIEPHFNRNSTEPGDAHAILHVMGKPKPWQGFDDERAGRLYWNALMHTPWKGEMPDALLDTAFTSPFNHRKASQCYRRVRERLYRDLLARNLSNLRGILRILFKELSCRVRLFFERPKTEKEKTAPGS